MGATPPISSSAPEKRVEQCEFNAQRNSTVTYYKLTQGFPMKTKLLMLTMALGLCFLRQRHVDDQGSPKEFIVRIILIVHLWINSILISLI